MRKALATIGTGPMRGILDLALPSFHRLADAHGYDVVIGSRNYAEDRPLAWGKVALSRALLAHYDVVLWLDADTVVQRTDIDPLSLVPADAFQAMVQHDGDNSITPNTGVWLLRSGEVSDAFLDAVWSKTEYLNHPFWENAAVLDLLGYSFYPDVSRPVRNSPWLGGTHFLGEEWNVHTMLRGGHSRGHIKHYAGCSNGERRVRLLVDRLPAGPAFVGHKALNQWRKVARRRDTQRWG